MDLPLVFLESLLMERPIIVGDLPPVNEALLGDSGLTVPYGDIPALTSALVKLLESAERRAQMGQNGRRAVLERCAPEGILATYHDIYRQIINRHRGITPSK